MVSMISLLVTVLVVGVILGLILWLVQNFIPMEARLKQAMIAIVVVIFVVWALLALVGAAPLIHIRG